LSGIDGRLNLLLSNIDIQKQRELQNDGGTAVRTRGRHLRQSWYLTKLSLEGRCNRRRHYIGGGSRVKRPHLNRWILYFW
jgi:hypothetical protein